MRPTRRTRRLLLALPAAVLALSTVGCGDLFEEAVEDQIEEAASEDGASIDIDDLQDGEFNVDTTDGGSSVGELPKDFPTDEVAVVDGEILGGTYTKNPPSWNVTIKVGEPGGDKAAAYDDAESTLLEGGAQTAVESVDNGTGITGTYTTATYTVQLAVTDANGVDVTYLVSLK